MTNRALGLIEVNGYLGAVVAADAGLKAANVSLLNIETVKSGIKTVQLVGDVSAVRAAVDAAVDAIGQEPYYRTSHVISRLDDQAQALLTPAKTVSVVEVIAEELATEVLVEADVKLEEPVLVEVIEEIEVASVAEATEKDSSYTREELEKLKVVELRSLAYREEGVGLTKKEIKFANKQVLIDALLNISGKE